MFSLAIIGNVNVGKTSFFNKLIDNNYSFISKKFGFSQDFHYGISSFFNKRFCFCIDVCGFFDFNFLKHKNIKSFNAIINYNRKRFIVLLKKVDLVCLIVDVTLGLSLNDTIICDFLRKKNKHFIIIVNKIDLLKNNDIDYKTSIFYSLRSYSLFKLSITKNLGFSEIKSYIFNSKIKYSMIKKDKFLHIKNMINLSINLNVYVYYILRYLKKNLNKNKLNKYLLDYLKKKVCGFIKMVVLGKPNVGKSTFLNSLSKKNNIVVSDQKGTTQDFIFLNLFQNKSSFVISDSPGLYNKSFFLSKKMLNMFLLFSVFIYMVDINYGLCKYDLYIINFLLKKGKAVILIFNKCDKILNFKYILYKNYLTKRFNFIKNVKIFFISALNLSKNEILSFLKFIYKNYFFLFHKKINSTYLTNLLKKANDNYCLENDALCFFKLKYAHIGNYYPFTIIIHGTNIKNLNKSYIRYLTNFYIKNLSLIGFYIKIVIKDIRTKFVIK